MGLLGNIKMAKSVMKDIIDIGVADFKACDQMEKLIEEARTHTTEAGFLNPNNLKCIREYDAAKKTREGVSEKATTEEKNALEDEVEKKQAACMKSFKLNKKFSEEFRKSCEEALALYEKANDEDALFDSIEDGMLNAYKFKTPEEKEIVHTIFQQSKRYSEATDQMDALIQEARSNAALTAADKAVVAAYDTAKAADQKASGKSNKKAQKANDALDQARNDCMAAFQKNMKLNFMFRASCRNAVKLYNDSLAAMEELKKYEK